MIFAYLFVVLSVFIAGFQLALALGAPLGEFTLGGKFPGILPPKIRVLTLVQLIILAGFNAIVMSRAGIAFPGLAANAHVGIWVVIAFFVVGSLANFSSQSKKERLLMGPLNILALFCTLMVALS